MVSIIVTFHNNQNYVSKCLDSIIAQEYGDIEIIIVDDGSSDNTSQVCDKYIKTSENISYTYIDSKGVSVARNKGIELAKGEYIMFVDGDDYLEPNIVKDLISIIDDSIDIVSCCCKAFEESSGFVCDCHFFNSTRFFQTSEEKKHLFMQLMDPSYAQNRGNIYTAIGVPWGKLYRSSFIRDNKLMFIPGLLRMQDNVFNMNAFQKANKVLYYDEPLYCYRINHIESINRKGNSPNIYIQILQHREKFFNDNETVLGDDLKRCFFRERITFLMRSFRNIVNSYEKKDAIIKMKLLCNDSIYKKFLNKTFFNLPKKQIVILVLIRLRLFSIIYVLIRKR